MIFMISDSKLQSYLTKMSVHDQHAIADRMIYIGNTFSIEEMANFYRLADTYVSPYQGEGFNIPVLEGAASGLPVICTSGGSTDDFVNVLFARKIRSKLLPIRLENIDGHLLEPDVQHLTDLMFDVIENAAWRRTATTAGPQHVASNFTWDTVTQLLTDALFGDARPNVNYNQTIRQVQVPRRNEQCPCGSGKKYKHCCGSYK